MTSYNDGHIQGMRLAIDSLYTFAGFMHLPKLITVPKIVGQTSCGAQRFPVTLTLMMVEPDYLSGPLKCPLI